MKATFAILIAARKEKMTFANAHRGLKLAQTNFVYLSEGAYGVIFVDKQANRIRKIYLRREDERHVRDVFKSESEAYSRARASKLVALLVPDDFRVCQGQVIIDKDGNDISQAFFTELAFETEYVDCTFQKIGSIQREEAHRIQTLFKTVGIKHTVDMSVCIDSEGRVLKAIDFAVEEFEVWHTN